MSGRHCLRLAQAIGSAGLRYVVVDALVVVIDGDGEHLLRILLADDEAVEVLINLAKNRRRDNIGKEIRNAEMMLSKGKVACLFFLLQNLNKKFIN